MNDPRPWVSLRTFEPTTFGSGWLSGLLSATLGLVGLGAVLCFHFPALLTVPEARALYPLPYVRALLHLVLVAAFVLGAFSLSLRRNKALGTVGVVAALAAALLGGSRVQVEGEPGAAMTLFSWGSFRRFKPGCTFIHANVRFEFGWLGPRDAPVPSLASRRGAGRGRQELRRPCAASRPRFRDGVPAGPLAVGLARGDLPPGGYVSQFVWPFQRSSAPEGRPPERSGA